MAPNVTSILGWKFPFNKEKWKKSEPNIDHDAVTRESTKRGNAVHLAMEKWLQMKITNLMQNTCDGLSPKSLSRKLSNTCKRSTVHYLINGLGAYAGSCDGLMLVNNEVVIIDYKQNGMVNMSTQNI